jgi:hypothetical protein
MPSPKAPSAPVAVDSPALRRLRTERADVDARYRQASYKGDADARRALEERCAALDDDILVEEVCVLSTQIVRQFQALARREKALLDWMDPPHRRRVRAAFERFRFGCAQIQQVLEQGRE